MQFAADTIAVSTDIAYRAAIAMASGFVRPSATADEILLMATSCGRLKSARPAKWPS